MSYNDKDYQRFAKSIVDTFVQQAVPLEDGVVKVADDRCMNAYEARRLLEATNLNAHLVLFEKMADHKYVEFDVVEPEKVASRLFASPDPDDHDDEPDFFGKVASLRLELPDERWDTLSHQVAEKLAAEAFPAAAEPEPEDPYAGDKMHHAIQLTNKVAEELKMAALAAHMEYTDKVAALAQTFNYVSSMPFEEFEKDAHALADSQVAATILAKVREHNPRLPESSEKTASATRYVVERKEHGMFREVVAAYNDALELAQGCAWMERQAEPLLR